MERNGIDFQRKNIDKHFLGLFSTLKSQGISENLQISKITFSNRMSVALGMTAV